MPLKIINHLLHLQSEQILPHDYTLQGLVSILLIIPLKLLSLLLTPAFLTLKKGHHCLISIPVTIEEGRMGVIEATIVPVGLTNTKKAEKGYNKDNQCCYYRDPHHKG